MPLAGKQWQPRDIAALSAEAFGRAGHEVGAVELVESVAICFAESQGRERAFNDNLDPDGTVKSRDVSLWEINIDGSLIGTQTEEDLYVPANNADAMVAKRLARGWQPWAAFNSGTYLFDSYLGRAAQGVGNYLAGVLLERETLHVDGSPYVHAWEEPVLDFHFRLAAAVGGISVAETQLGWSSRSKAQVTKIHEGLAHALTRAKLGRP